MAVARYIFLSLGKVERLKGEAVCESLQKLEKGLSSKLKTQTNPSHMHKRS